MSTTKLSNQVLQSIDQNGPQTIHELAASLNRKVNHIGAAVHALKKKHYVRELKGGKLERVIKPTPVSKLKRPKRKRSGKKGQGSKNPLRHALVKAIEQSSQRPVLTAYIFRSADRYLHVWTSAGRLSPPVLADRVVSINVPVETVNHVSPVLAKKAEMIIKSG